LKIQIQPNPGLVQQNLAKFLHGINFVFLVRIEPYQGLTPTPRAFFLSALLPALKEDNGIGRVSFPTAAKRTIGNP